MGGFFDILEWCGMWFRVPRPRVTLIRLVDSNLRQPSIGTEGMRSPQFAQESITLVSSTTETMHVAD